ncbi:GNAT family N-acetyltransferase [Pseudoalteromonas sp. T1lg48]|uniref:GNAT family N-acetyltransferase n=1 Tax=Pseudoalteromonas sp. T1lg48 TaxID=2077100 RepID=UPI000CF73DCA|nr:GNAT family N-acetyltransferase [Pseudoalteromonas sp. T1lg48]
MTLAVNGWSPPMLACKHSEVTNLLSQLKRQRWRQALLLRGERQWCYEQLIALQKLTAAPWYVLSNNEKLRQAQWPHHLHQILGQEHAHAAYDCYSGFYADKLAALAGTVQAGGLLVLMLPEDTSTFIDPGMDKLVSYGYSTPTQSHFWAWLEQQLVETDFVSIKQSAGSSNCITLVADTPEGNARPDTSEQLAVVEQIIKTAKGRAHRPLLISADRGRGKSAALGIAAGQLSDKRIILCAVQRRAVSTVFKHLSDTASLAEAKDTDLSLGNVEYMPPDRVLHEQPSCDLLLVDEAATLPIHILKQLLAIYPRVVFASTLAGYEGSGRGYTLRFKAYLQRHYSNFRERVLNEPFRFASGDPLEQGINKLLVLDAASKELQPCEQALTHIAIDTAKLREQPELLKQVFALLVLAHYQTSANDFRQLLDAPGQRIYLSRKGEQLVAVAVITLEGRFDEQMAAQVVSGERRPQAHLLAQSLAQLSGESQLAQVSCARIVRIAVHPQLHHQGIGSDLMNFIGDDLTQHKVAILGTSFGAHASLLEFWQRLGLSTIKLGIKRDHVSGEYSALMAKGLTEQGTQLLSPVIKAWQKDLPHLIAHYFADLESRLLLKLLCECPKAEPSQADHHTLMRFTLGQIPLAQAYGALRRYLQSNWLSLAMAPKETQEVILALIFNSVDAKPAELSKKQYQQLIKSFIQQLLK